MIKCRRRQATDPQKFKKIVSCRFLSAEEIGVEAEAVDEIAASTSLVDTRITTWQLFDCPKWQRHKSWYYEQSSLMLLRFILLKA